MKKTASFTLIELLVVLSLIALATTTLHFSFTSFSAKKKIEGELFRFKETIFFAQDIMVTAQLTSKIVLKQCPEGIEMNLSSDLPEKCFPLSSRYLYKEFQKIEFNEQKVKELILHFDAHLGCTSQGVLQLTDKNHQIHTFYLKGFPSRLHA